MLLERALQDVAPIQRGAAGDAMRAQALAPEYECELDLQQLEAGQRTPVFAYANSWAASGRAARFEAAHGVLEVRAQRRAIRIEHQHGANLCGQPLEQGPERRRLLSVGLGAEAMPAEKL